MNRSDEEVYSWLLGKGDSPKEVLERDDGGMFAMEPALSGIQTAAGGFTPLGEDADILQSGFPVNPLGSSNDMQSTEQQRKRARRQTTPAMSGRISSVTRNTMSQPGSSSDLSKGSPKRKKGGTRDREVAKEARRRKKEKVNELEEKVHALENENLQLRLQLKVGKETVQRDEQEKWTITKQLADMVTGKATNAEFEQVLKTYVKKFSDYGVERSNSITKHMDQLARLLLPTQVTKMCMWTLLQNDDFYKSDDSLGGAASSGLWSIVCKHIEATEEQQEKLKQYRGDAKQLAMFLRHTFREAEELKKRMAQKNHSLAIEMKELQSVLTPQQLAKFILWVNNNPASMAMLDQLWNPEDDAKDKQFLSPTNSKATAASPPTQLH